ncbi:MAG: LysM peptidoglycan-binding domain-containing protein [Chloroflexota bacterium]
MRQTVRRMASGIVYAIVSLLLVIGSLSLSLAQGGTAGPPTSTPRALPTGTSTRIPTPQPTPTGSASATTSPTVVATQIVPTSTYLYPTLAAPQPTSTFARACGPFAGWVKGYVVQPGDTLFRIAPLHGIQVDALQRANCRTNTMIYAGERLWVPFVLRPPTQLTIIPTFDTPTEPATPTASPTPTSTATDGQDP